MTLLVPAVGEAAIALAMVNKTGMGLLTCHLYQNNHTPSLGDTAAVYTEATFVGYAAVALTAANWTSSGSGPTSITFPAATVVFTSTAGAQSQPIYGYYVTNAVGTLIWAEKFPFAQVIQNLNDAITCNVVATVANAIGGET